MCWPAPNRTRRHRCRAGLAGSGLFHFLRPRLMKSSRSGSTAPPLQYGAHASRIWRSDQSWPIIVAIASRMLLCHLLNAAGFKQRDQFIVGAAGPGGDVEIKPNGLDGLAVQGQSTARRSRLARVGLVRSVTSSVT